MCMNVPQSEGQPANHGCPELGTVAPSPRSLALTLHRHICRASSTFVTQRYHHDHIIKHVMDIVSQPLLSVIILFFQNFTHSEVIKNPANVGQVQTSDDENQREPPYRGNILRLKLRWLSRETYVTCSLILLLDGSGFCCLQFSFIG